MTKKEILNYLELITDELTDAYHLTDTDGTVDANYAVSTAQELVEELHHNIENNISCIFMLRVVIICKIFYE